MSETKAPEIVWMHNSLGYWFSVADECKEDGDLAYIPLEAHERAVAEARRETWESATAVLHETLRERLATDREHEIVSNDRLNLLRAMEAASK